MKLSELINHIGDEHIQVQPLTGSLYSVELRTQEGLITFATDRDKVAALAGQAPVTHRGMVVWMPIDRMPQLPQQPAPPAEEPSKIIIPE